MSVVGRVLVARDVIAPGFVVDAPEVLEGGLDGEALGPLVGGLAHFPAAGCVDGELDGPAAEVDHQFAQVKAEPDLLHNAIEESLRYETPITMIPRVAAEDIEWHGQVFRRGQVVQLNMASANRDDAHFHDPDSRAVTASVGRHCIANT